MDQESDFKKSIIGEVRKYPIIWNYSMKAPLSYQTEKAWNEISSVLNIPPATTRRQWNSLRGHYIKLLMVRTIERDNTCPKWAYFHQMSFLYENVKWHIKEKLGGISPPLLEPNTDQRDPEAKPCPCCVPAAKLIETTPSQQPITRPPNTEAVTLDLDVKKTETTVGNSISKCSINTLSAQGDNLSPSVVNMPLKRPGEPQNNQDQVGKPLAKRNRERLSNLPQEKWLTLRSKIIERIKAFPVLYARTQYAPKVGLSLTWKKVSEEFELPVHVIQTRWRAWKKRYAEELSRQIHSGGKYRSTWNSFEQMSFVTPYLKSNEGNILRMRQEIQKIIEERKNPQTIDHCTDDDEEPPSDSDAEFSNPDVEPVDIFKTESQDVEVYNVPGSPSDLSYSDAQMPDEISNFESIDNVDEIIHQDGNENCIYIIEVCKDEPE